MRFCVRTAPGKDWLAGCGFQLRNRMCRDPWRAGVGDEHPLLLCHEHETFQGNLAGQASKTTNLAADRAPSSNRSTWSSRGGLPSLRAMCHETR